jgi:hypothetical protein
LLIAIYGMIDPVGLSGKAMPEATPGTSTSVSIWRAALT